MKKNRELLSPKIQKEVINILRINPSVIACYIFGSRVNNNEDKTSDLDVAIVVSDRKYYQELDILPQISKISFPKEVDLSVVDLTVSPLFLYQIISKGICIYEKSKFERVEFESKVQRIYFDTQHMRDIYHLSLEKSFRENTYGHR